MHAGLLDVLHDAADDDIGAVGERVNVHLGGFFEELVDEDGAGGSHHGGLRDIFLHGVDVVGNDHGAATQDVAGANEDGKADFTGHARGFFGHERGTIARLRNAQLVEQTAKAAAIFGEVDRFRGGA